MKRKLIAIFVVMANVMVIFGCTGNGNDKEKEETTAVQNELVISEGSVVSGKKVWNDFRKSVDYGEPARITIRQYYPSARTGATVPIPQTETKIRYDGEKFFVNEGANQPFLNTDIMVDSEDRLSMNDVKTYKYLIERSGHLPNAAVSDHGFYLVNDDTLTFEQIQWSVFSSQSSDWIDFYPVFTEYSPWEGASEFEVSLP